MAVIRLRLRVPEQVLDSCLQLLCDGRVDQKLRKISGEWRQTSPTEHRRRLVAPECGPRGRGGLDLAKSADERRWAGDETREFVGTILLLPRHEVDRAQ